MKKTYDELKAATRGMTNEEVRAWQSSHTGTDASTWENAIAIATKDGWFDAARCGYGSTSNESPATNHASAFDVRPMADVVNEGASLPPIPRIAGPLLYEGDLAILFGPTNIGKTPFALVIAEQFCSGSIIIDDLPCEAKKGNALFVDFELSPRQQGSRYRANDGTAFQFSNQPGSCLYRGEWKGLGAGRKDFTSYIVDRIATEATNVNARLVVIDNLTALRAQGEKAFDAAALVSSIKQRLCIELGVTVILIGHLPKTFATIPLTLRDLAGSANFGNLTDSVFSIAKSEQGKYIRRIQQHKSRNSSDCSVTYDSQHNLILESYQRSDGLISFRFVGISPEREHLPTEVANEETKAAIIRAKQANPNRSNRDIAREHGTNAMMVGRTLKSVTSVTTGDVTHVTCEEDSEAVPGDIDVLDEHDPFARHEAILRHAGKAFNDNK